MLFWVLNGIMLVLLIVSLARVAMALTSDDEAKRKHIAIELIWAVLLTLLLLYNFGVINF